MDKKLDVQLCFDYDIEELNVMGHRSGWKNVIKKLYEINNSTSDKKILLLDVMEKTFCWNNKVPKEQIYYNGQHYAVSFDEIRTKKEGTKSVYVVELDNQIVKWDGDMWVNCPDITLEEFFALQNNDFLPNGFKPEYDWIGILHNTYNMPKWFFYKYSPQCLLERSVFKNYLSR